MIVIERMIRAVLFGDSAMLTVDVCVHCSYDYSIQKGKADIRFVDLKATISLGVSGKMNLFCESVTVYHFIVYTLFPASRAYRKLVTQSSFPGSGDCDPVDYRMTNTLGAVERLCRMADSCKLPDVGKAVVTPNRQNTGKKRKP